VTIVRASASRPKRDAWVTIAPTGLDETPTRAFKWLTMQQNCDTTADFITVQFAPAEVLALHSFLALGAHFAAIISGENSPLAPDELRAHVAAISEVGASTLTDKLVGAVAEVRKRGRQQLLAAPEVDGGRQNVREDEPAPLVRTRPHRIP
jgi:hypothetical protein